MCMGRKGKRAIAAVIVNSIVCGTVISGCGGWWAQPVGAVPAPISGSSQDWCSSGSDCRNLSRSEGVSEAMEAVRLAQARYQRLLQLSQSGAVSLIVAEQAKQEYQQALERLQDERDRPYLTGDRANLRAQLDLAKWNYERMQLLYNEGAIAQVQMLQAQQTYQRLLNEYRRTRVPGRDRSK
jgi:multidrug resistance efflux pump